MKKLLIILLIALGAVSCTQVDTNVIEKVWVLESTIPDSPVEPNTTYYSFQSDKTLTITTRVEGVVQESYSGTWYWDEEEENITVIINGGITNFEILELNSNKLSYTTSNTTYNYIAE